MKVRKKPVVVDAFPVRELIEAARDRWDLLPPSVKDAYEHGYVLFMNSSVSVKTLEGTVTAQINDYLMKGTAGEWYPCRREIFEQVYEQVTE